VIDVATLSVIRRWALREQLSIREIARRSGLSRNTIKKYLASGVVEPRYAKRTGTGTGTGKLDPFAEKLAQWLRAEQAKNRKQQRTLLRMGLKPASLSSSTRGRPRRQQPGPWQGRLVHALHLVDEIGAHGIDDPCWTLAPPLDRHGRCRTHRAPEKSPEPGGSGLRARQGQGREEIDAPLRSTSEARGLFRPADM
jgi:transcriptional regulator with XRE-family HTH domain